MTDAGAPVTRRRGAGGKPAQPRPSPRSTHIRRRPQRPALLLLRAEAREQAGKTARCRGRLSGRLHALRHQRTGAAGRHKARLPARQPRREISAAAARSAARARRVAFSARKAGAMRATNTPRSCRNSPARIASARNCASWNAAWRSARRLRRWRRSRSPILTWMPSVLIRSPNIIAHSNKKLRWWQPWKARFRARRRAAGPSRRSSSRGITIGCSSTATARRATTSGSRKIFLLSPNATSAQWRVAWTAVLKRAAGSAATILQEHLRRFPGSPYTPDALYWLGRLAEEAGCGPARARLLREIGRSAIRKTISDVWLPRASARLGPGPAAKLRTCSLPFRPSRRSPKLDGPIPPAAVGRQARADALRSIGFRRFRRTRIARRICRHGRAALAARGRAGRGGCRPLRRGDRNRPADFPAARIAAIFERAARRVARGVRAAVRSLRSGAGPRKPEWIRCWWPG